MWKILYDDGDVEILRLEKERWELLDKGRKSTKVSGFPLVLIVHLLFPLEYISYD